MIEELLKATPKTATSFKSTMVKMVNSAFSFLTLDYSQITNKWMRLEVPVYEIATGRLKIPA